MNIFNVHYYRNTTVNVLASTTFIYIVSTHCIRITTKYSFTVLYSSIVVCTGTVT